MLWIILALILALITYIYVQNRLPKVTSYTVTVPELHSEVKGKKIVQLTDSHLRPNSNKSFIEHILNRVNEEQPDLIVFTGDFVQAGLDDFVDVPIRKLFEGLSNCAPTYVVTGNHDIASGKFEDLAYILNTSKVRLLVDEAEWISFGKGDAGFVLMGLAERKDMLTAPKPRLRHIELTEGMVDKPKILLAHHPEFFEEYLDDKTKAPVLTLAGHTHGGQAILPLFGGVYSPGQGALPKYDFGMFSSKEDPARRLLVSRGIGNSTFPIRINNRPEIVSITLN